MAKVLFTAVVADMRNSLAGTVFARNRYGAYARNRTTPANPNTAAQQAVRASFSAVATAWRTLTEAQRLTWNRSAINFPYTDIFGNQRFLSGQQLFQKLNTNLTFISQANLTSPPGSVALPKLTTLSIEAFAGPQQITITCDLAKVPDGFYAVVDVTPSLSAGISFARKYYRFSGYLANGADFNGKQITADFGTLQGHLVEDEKVFIRIYFISITTGIATIAFPASCIIQG